MNSKNSKLQMIPLIKSVPARAKQRGVALAVSLILLVAMTILGVATLNGTRLAEKVTSNAQQKAITFEVAESAINAVYLVDRFKGSMQGFSGAGNQANAVEQNDVAAMLADEFDQQNGLGKSVDVNAVATIQYCGEGQPWGTDLDANLGASKQVYHLFDVVGDAQINNSNARSRHVKRAGYPRPSMGFTVTCTTPGTN